MKKLLILVLIGIFSTSWAFAETPQAPSMNPEKIQTRQFVHKVSGNLERGQYRNVRFVVPSGNVLLDLQIKTLSRYPNHDDPFLARSITGWRLTHIDKFPEYNSAKQPETAFSVEMWAHKYGQWFAPQNSELELQVSYAYYDLSGVEEEEFSLVVDQTLANIHPLAIHISAKEAFEVIDQTGSARGIEEILLRANDRCFWGSRPTCSDCMLTKYNSSTGKRTHRYFYNARAIDGYCE